MHSDRKGIAVHIAQQQGGHRHFGNRRDERQNKHHRQNRYRQREQHQAESLPWGRTVQRRRFFQRAVDGFEVTFDRPDVQRDTAHIGEDDAAVGIQADERHVLAESVKQGIQRDQRQHRGEHLENQHPFQQRCFTREAHAGKSVSAGGRKRDDANGGNACHLDGVPQPQQYREGGRRDATISVFDAEAERQPPVLPGDTFGDQATGGEVPFAQRDSDDHQQREHNRRDKNQQQEVRC